MGTDHLQLLLERLNRIEAALESILNGLAVKDRPAQEWLSIDEVAAVTGLSADHVRRHVTSGMLPVCNQGTYEKPYYRIRRADVDAWMSQRMQEPGPAPRKRKAGPGGYASRHHDKAGS